MAAAGAQRVVVVGGMLEPTDDGDAPLRTEPTVYGWDAAGDRWQLEAELQTARYLHGTVALDTGELLVVGGFTDARTGDAHSGRLTALASVERRGPDGTWSRRAPLPVALAEPSATLLGDGRVLVCGGYGDEVTSFAAVYDPVGDRWERTAPMALPRAGHRAARLPDGRVLVVGGTATFDGEAVEPAEIWDPARGAWISVEGPRWPRFGHTATLLADGRVLVAGGSAGEELLGAAEIWRPR